jgi:hypothetical protein
VANKNLDLLRADLGVLEEVMACFSWDNDGEVGGTVRDAIRAVNESAGADDGHNDDTLRRDIRGVAMQHGLGDDAVMVDKLVVEMERRCHLSHQLCERLMKQFKSMEVDGLEKFSDPNTATRNSPVRNRTVSTMDAPDAHDDKNLEDLHVNMSGAKSARRRASSAQGRYLVPGTQQCSVEVQLFIKTMTNYSNLVKSFNTIRSMKEGLWTPSMAKQLAEEPSKETKKMEWLEKKCGEFQESFENMLKEDSRENAAFIDCKTLSTREMMLLQRAADNEQTKLANVKMSSRNGHLKDAVAMMSGALSKSMAFYKHELAWLEPRIHEAESVSKIFNETIHTVNESTKSLVTLFKQKGEELQELQRLSTDDEADRKILQVEKEVWARKRKDLEKVMLKRTRMAKVASSSFYLTREENAAFEKSVVESECQLKEVRSEYDAEQQRVDKIYEELQDVVQSVQVEAHEVEEKEKLVMRQKAQVSIKKNELEKLQNRLNENGKYGNLSGIDVEKDIKRMSGQLAAARQFHREMESELQGVEQKLFELELHKMEAKFSAGGGDYDNDGAISDDAGDGDSDSDVMPTRAGVLAGGSDDSDGSDDDDAQLINFKWDDDEDGSDNGDDDGFGDDDDDDD